MARPTDSAKEILMQAAYKLAVRRGSVKDPNMADLMEAMRRIAVGLHDMSVGLRAYLHAARRGEAANQELGRASRP
jgi:hypothetical protein